jgi:pimeloyl-ACP methyl ester carboxylesterase
MRALVAQGNAAEALLVYERLRRLLYDELGTIPSLGMIALHRWVLEGTVEPKAAKRNEEMGPEPISGYTRNADGISIAYQILGDGPVDLVIVPGFMSHLDAWWTYPEYRAWLRQLASFARIITLDKAGTGASDPVDHVPTVTEWTSDVLIVLDEVRSKRAVLLGMSEAGPVTIALTLRAPERVAGLVLYAGIARWWPAPHYLWEYRQEILPALEHFREVELAGWGHGASIDTVAPSLATNDTQRRAWAVFERASGSPASISQRLAALEGIDVCHLLAQVRVPTLVLHRHDDCLIPPFALHRRRDPRRDTDRAARAGPPAVFRHARSGQRGERRGPPVRRSAVEGRSSG